MPNCCLYSLFKTSQTVYNLQRAGQLPGAKIGGQLRFLRKALDAMLDPSNHKG